MKRFVLSWLLLTVAVVAEGALVAAPEGSWSVGEPVAAGREEGGTTGSTGSLS